MRPSLEELTREVEVVAPELRAALEAQQWTRAREFARRLLSAGSRLHAQLGVLEELAADAQWAAAVDRAVRDGKPPAAPAEIPGQAQLPTGSPAKKPRGKRTP